MLLSIEYYKNKIIQVPVLVLEKHSNYKVVF